MSHTPGPWILANDNRTILGGKALDEEFMEKWICEVGDVSEGLEGDCPEADANAKLIVAAPDLLATIQDLCTRMERARPILQSTPAKGHWGMLDTTEARALLAKIDGEAVAHA